MKPSLGLMAVGLALFVASEVSADGLSTSYIIKAVNDAKRLVDNAYTYSRAESIRRVRRSRATPSDLMRLLKQPSREARSAVRARDYLDNALRLIEEHHHRIHKRSLNATDLLTEEELETIVKLSGCEARQRPPKCDGPTVDKYRTASSVCNNRRFPRRGASNMPVARWLPPQYQDGLSLPRGWDPEVKINGHVLPLVREVSNRILNARNEDIVSDFQYTFLLTFFGQWTDHDLTETPQSPSIRSFNSGINCDESCERSEPCFPIGIPPNDTRNLSENDCIPVFRSAPACGTGNTGFLFGAATLRHQINSLTSFIDGGQVYGSEDGLAHDLRDLTNEEGLLRVNTNFTDNGREVLTFTNVDDKMCDNRRRITGDSNAQEFPCFLAGDIRVIENIALGSIHTTMMREHNRLARALRALNPYWSGETIYQEARKILGAHFQVITFRDYLPLIVGPGPYEDIIGDYPGYDENVDPTIASVFATAAFRFAHLTLQPMIMRLNESYQVHPEFPPVFLHTGLFTPWRLLFEGGIDPVLRGLFSNPAKLNTQDQMLVSEVRERLFEFLGRIALDLGSLNMQRGRDHGIPGYNAWRGFCGLSQPRNSEELAVVLNNTKLAENIFELYGTADNIDVWLGGVAEPFVPGARVGPLFACIISRQFSMIRQGDRFWWENEGVFTPAQRRSLKTASLARIICDNTAITDIPEDPFLFRPRGSGYTPCADIPEFDLRPWRDSPRRPTDPPHPESPAAFSVRLAQSDPPIGKPIVFKEVIYNGQNLYDTTTGKFTCSDDGVYQFDFHLSFDEKVGNVDLRRNGRVVVHSHITQDDGSYITASGGTILELTKGDTVFLTTTYDGNGLIADSYFSGHILS